MIAALKEQGQRLTAAPLKHHRPVDVIAQARGADQALARFTLRCWARAYLHAVDELSLHEAVDELQRAAERDGLVDAIGADGVQEIMGREFARVRA